jgi:hypothetical protein
MPLIHSTLFWTNTQIRITCSHQFDVPADLLGKGALGKRGPGRPRSKTTMKVTSEYIVDLLVNANEVQMHGQAVQAHFAQYAHSSEHGQLEHGVWIALPLTPYTYAWNRVDRDNCIQLG